MAGDSHGLAKAMRKLTRWPDTVSIQHSVRINREIAVSFGAPHIPCFHYSSTELAWRFSGKFLKYLREIILIRKPQLVS